jgi:protein O-GlcNAc transferase
MSKVNLQQTLQQAYALHQKGDHRAAETLYRVVLSQLPDQPDALYLLGQIHHAAGRHDQAEPMLRRSIELKPDFAMYLRGVGLFYAGLKRFVEAGPLLERACRVEPSNAENWYHLAQLQMRMNQPADAADSFRRRAELMPSYASAWAQLAFALEAVPDNAAAIANYEKALSIDPKLMMARVNYPTVLANSGQIDRAVELIHGYLIEMPGVANLHSNLANVLGMAKRYVEALAASREAVRLDPASAEARCNLASHLSILGQLDQATSEYRKAIELNPDDPAVFSDMIWALQHGEMPDESANAALHREYDARYAAPRTRRATPCKNDRDPGRRLRVAFISPDFRAHPVTFFFEPVLKRLDRDAFHVTLYHVATGKDVVTERLANLADTWREAGSAPPATLAQMIRDDAIDIAIDLTGHTGHHRLLALAEKPAPVQCTWLGYPNGSGVAAIDYRITDIHADPPGTTESLYAETLARLPECFACFEPIDAAPDVNELPSRSGGGFNFSCVGRMAKLTDSMLAAWKRILDGVPDARLTVISTGLNEPALDAMLCGRLRAIGIDPDRVVRLGTVGFADFLKLHHQIDLGLDTFPFNGHTTTVQGLWMGVPVVTIAGVAHRSRMGASVLNNAGLAEFVTNSIDEYVERTIRLAGERTKLNEIRLSMRERLKRSPLMQTERFTRHFESSLRAMWRTWVSSS